MTDERSNSLMNCILIIAVNTTVKGTANSHHYHLLWPTNKCFGNGGLFLAAHISTCLFISRNSAVGGCPLKRHSPVIAEQLQSFFLDVTILLACRTDSASVRNTAMVLFFCESTTREIVIINASAFQLLQCLRVAVLTASVLPLGK